MGVNAVLIDFLLYDLAKEREAAGKSCIMHYIYFLSPCMSPLPVTAWRRLDHVVPSV